MAYSPIFPRREMAGFAAQAALRAKWSSLVEEHSIEVPPEVTNKVTTVVGWLKQVIMPIAVALACSRLVLELINAQ